MTDKTKTICPMIFDLRGMKIGPVLNSLRDIAGKRGGNKTGGIVLYVLCMSRKKIKRGGVKKFLSHNIQCLYYVYLL